MKINYLADCPEEAKTIAHWYFSEWGYTVPTRTADKVLDKLKTSGMGRDGFPAVLTLHAKEALCACAELEFKENKHHPEYEHWIGGVYVQENSRGNGYSAALVEIANAISTQKNIDLLYLQCEDKIIALYLKCGFKILHVPSTTVLKLLSWFGKTQNSICATKQRIEKLFESFKD